MQQPVPATPLETKEALLKRSQRRSQVVPIRNAFVQRGTQTRPEPGPLAELVRRHDEQALDQYLLALALGTAPPYAVRRRADVWARALESKVSAVSKGWARLEARGLVRRGREGRLAVVTLLREDGTGEDYSHPGAGQGERYFGLPFAYWLDGFDTKLDLPGKAALLIAMSLRAGFVLPEEKAKPWYGLSGDTIQRGLAQLVKLKILQREKTFKTAPLAPLGYTEEYRYAPRPPFGRRPKSVANDEPADQQRRAEAPF